MLPTWLIGMMVASTGLQVMGAVQQGRAQKAAYEREAEMKRIEAEGAELERQQALGRALAANAVAAGMSGIKMEGTPASIALETAKTASLESGMAGLTSRLQQAQLRRQGANAARAGNIAGLGSLLSGATQIGMATGGYGNNPAGGGEGIGDISTLSSRGGINNLPFGN